MDVQGIEMYRLVEHLFPLPRSITGDGVRNTLQIIKGYLPELQLIEVPSGTRCFDWIVPQEWNIREAWIIDPKGTRIVDFKNNNLHLVGYSTPVDSTFTLEELDAHLHSLTEQPDAIPYVTSYYERTWGFCLTDRMRRSLEAGSYRVKIDSSFIDGHITYAELRLPGESEREIFLSTYICHPSMANNELSGPVVATFLSRWIASRSKRKFSYRIVFVPETIGSILYLSKNLDEMKRRTMAGFVLTCIGDERAFSFLPSRSGNTIADKIAKHVMKHACPDFTAYSFLDRGSDERQYCSPGIDLPVATVMRSKFGTYPEYHTSLDNLSLVTPDGLSGGLRVMQRVVDALESDCIPQTATLCEPQLGRRGLYPMLSTAATRSKVRDMMNLIAYADGCNTLIDIAELIGVPVWELRVICDALLRHGLLRELKT